MKVDIDLDKIKKELGELYLKGFYDRDWKVSEDKADEIASNINVEEFIKSIEQNKEL